MKVLVNAYACCPGMGSEPGMGWNWCAHLAEHCELFIITEEEFRDRIEAALPALPQGANMHFYYNPVTPEVRRMCWNQGDWRFYYYYRKWQKKTLAIAKKIVADEGIDIIHQLNMIGFREPGLLWKIEGPRFVWGPVGGMETMPVAYLKGAGFKTLAFNVVKNVLNYLQCRFQPNVRRAIRKSAVLVSATKSSVDKIRRYHRKDSVLLNETGCEAVGLPVRTGQAGEGFNIVWAGKFDFRKQLGLALRVIAECKDLDLKLHILGTGPDADAYRSLSASLGIADKCVWHGQVARDEVLDIMAGSDLFLFTSIMEGTSTVVMEAVQNHLPVICFDACGFGTVVDGSIGRKVRLSDPERSVKDFAAAVRHLYMHPEELQRMRDNCTAKAAMLEWDRKAEEMYGIYKSALQ